MADRSRYGLRACILVGFFGVIATTGVSQDIRFEHVTVDDGLSNNSINAVLEDSRGYLWVGTIQGLNRYDGYGVKVYRHIPSDTTSLSDDKVWALHEGRDGMLWVGTENGGLNRFNPATDIFTAYRHREGDATSLSSDLVAALHEGRDGTLWVGTFDGGLNRFAPATGRFTAYRYREGDATSLSNDDITALHQGRDGTLWVGTFGGGLNRFDPATGTFTAYRYREGDATSLSSDRVRSLHQGRDGTLWVGTFGGGLNRFNPATDIFTAYRHREGDATSLSDDQVWAIHEGPGGMLWVGTYDGGLNRFAPATGRFTAYRHREGDAISLSDDQVRSLHQGRDGTFWVGTEGGGLNRFAPATGTFTAYRYREGDETSLNNDDITALHEGRDGTLWVGTYLGGLNRFDPATGRFTAYRHREGEETSLSSDLVAAYHQGRDGTLWVGTFGGGLIRLAPATGTFTTYRHREGDTTSLSDDRVTVLHVSRDSTFWVGTWLGGLNRFDPATGTFTAYRHREGDATSLSSDRVRTLHEGPGGTLWVGTEGGGLNRLAPATGTFTAYRHREGDATSLSSDRVRSLHQGRDGTLWVGTGNGLNRMEGNPSTDPASPSFIRYTAETSNFEGGAVMSILEDDLGMLWLGLMSGKLARFNPNSDHFRFFGPRQGIQVGGFSQATARTGRGRMYFGTSGSGLIAFEPTQFQENTQPPRLYLSELRLFNQVITPGPNALLKAPLSETKKIVLGHDENDLSIGFVGIHYADPVGNRYDYRLVNYDRDWRGVTDARRATYTSLPPGDYTFEVKAANSDGMWTEEPVRLDVVIRPPWWRTPWAYVLYTLIVIGAIGGAFRWQHARIVRNEREVARERELEQAREIERAHTELQQAHTHLKMTQQQLIQAEKLASLGQLTSGIAHEIKNPLNFVNNFAEVNAELADEAIEGLERGERKTELLAILQDLKQNAQVINQHGKRADGIVHAMMQHASGSAGQRESTNINQLVSEHIDLAYHGKRAQLEDLQVEIKQDLGSKVGTVEVVPQEIGRVLLNLLGNAFDAVYEQAQSLDDSYAPTVTVSTRKVDGTVEIRVKDNGSGIPAEIRDRIFEPFFTTKPTGSGTGLGLSLAYDIITQGHGGTLTVESTKPAPAETGGEGAMFIITLPVRRP